MVMLYIHSCYKYNIIHTFDCYISVVQMEELKLTGGSADAWMLY